MGILKDIFTSKEGKKEEKLSKYSSFMKFIDYGLDGFKGDSFDTNVSDYSFLREILSEKKDEKLLVHFLKSTNDSNFINVASLEEEQADSIINRDTVDVVTFENKKAQEIQMHVLNRLVDNLKFSSKDENGTKLSTCVVYAVDKNFNKQYKGVVEVEKVANNNYVRVFLSNELLKNVKLEEQQEREM